MTRPLAQQHLFDLPFTPFKPSHSMNTTPNTPARWQFWIDRGGTFTDVVGKRPDGTLVTIA